ncbi:MAG: sugar ABC transporter permease [Roseburia sp.]|nr:sugar ABC transporter permease [Roseburia sp.]
MKKSKLAMRNARDGYLLVMPLMLGFLLFYAIPFLIVVYNSMTKGMGYSKLFAGLENYQDLLGNAVFRLAFGNTMKFLLIALPLITVLSYAIALLIKNQTKKNGQLKSVLLLPYIMPIVGTVLLVELLFAEAGVINTTLYGLGLPIVDWLNSEYAFLVVVLLYIWKNFGYSVILLLSGLITISEEQYKSASLDGANAWQMFVHITMPQMWYSVFFATVFSLINAFKCFREIFLIGGTHPNPSIYMLQHFINNAFEKLNYAKLSVASVLLFLIITAVFAVFYHWVMRKEAYRG